MIEAVRHVVTADTVTREGLEGGNWKVIDQKDAHAVLSQLPTTVNTDMLPPGVRYLRESGGVAQMVQEMAPGTYTVAWARSEGQARSNSPLFRVYQPWITILSKWHDGVLIGARMFYRPGQLCTLDDELYHTNLPNVNGFGYNGTSVGWVCFYSDRVDTRTMTWAQRAMRMYERAGGGEAYSENNMHGIDGPAVYRQYRPKLTWAPAPALWEKKSKSAGAKLWKETKTGGMKLVPVLVAGIDEQNQHNEKGVPLTVRMALDGKANWYYHDAHNPAPAAAAVRGLDVSGRPNSVTNASFNAAYSRALKQVKGKL